ncbi:hypothetical protein B0H11DRAFT_1905041 [Mycena galericulata]|nr:hypothetical protein B0H11DRAFT_1905041 [Mycena galericulata]
MMLRYQIVLKEMWDSLISEEQSDWDAKAEDECGDARIDVLKVVLAGTSIQALRHDELIEVLTVFMSTFGGEDLADTYGMPWDKFAEGVIPPYQQHEKFSKALRTRAPAPVTVTHMESPGMPGVNETMASRAEYNGLYTSTPVPNPDLVALGAWLGTREEL